MIRIARPTDAEGRAQWEQTVRQRRGRKPRPFELIDEPTDLSWDEALARIAKANEIISRIATRIARKRDGIPAKISNSVHNGSPGGT